jgi:hypothetical protein
LKQGRIIALVLLPILFPQLKFLSFADAILLSLRSLRLCGLQYRGCYNQPVHPKLILLVCCRKKCYSLVSEMEFDAMEEGGMAKDKSKGKEKMKKKEKKKKPVG